MDVPEANQIYQRSDTLNGPNAIAAFIPFFAANINLLVNTFKVEEDMLKGDKDKHLKDILIGLIISSIVLQVKFK